MGDYKLYVLELEPGEDDHAKWYVGITTDIQQRMYEHYGCPQVDWVARNEVVDHIVVGEWGSVYAEKFENELTGLLMHEYGYDTTRGGKYTNPDDPGTPDLDPEDPSPELLRELADTDHDGLIRVVVNYPLLSYRRSVVDGRENTRTLLLYDNTAEADREAHERLEARLGSDLHEFDAREAIYLAGMQNLDDAEEILLEWGADF